MATPLIFQLDGEDSACHLNKVDRSKLYGYVDKEVLDENDAPCELTTLASDGKTLIGNGGTTFAYFDADGQWCDKGDLQAVDLDNQPITAAPSSFKAPIKLTETTTIEHYLSHNVRSVYVLVAEGDGFSPSLVKALKEGAIYTFPFSYRGGLDPDVGFLLQGEDDTIWLALGKPTEIRMASLTDSSETVPDDEGSSDDGDFDMDFGMI